MLAFLVSTAKIVILAAKMWQLLKIGKLFGKILFAAIFWQDRSVILQRTKKMNI